MMNRLFLVASACFLIALLAGCATTPGGRMQLMLTSESTETQAGSDAWTEVVQTEKPSTDQVKIAALQRVGRNLAEVSGKANLNWDFRVFYSTTPNAFALPGGKVAVYDSLYSYVSSDAELAAVIGHEICHVLARHGGERMSQTAVRDWAGKALGKAVSDHELTMIAYGAVSNVTLILPYSRKHEYEADVLGMKLMAKAGYDPRAAISFWQKFSQAGGSNSRLTAYFSTHPAGSDRIAELQRALPDAVTIYNTAPVRRGLGNSL